MILQTGGSACGATSTRSRSMDCAVLRACAIPMMPNCSPPGPTTRTSGTRIRSFSRGSGAIGYHLSSSAADQPPYEPNSNRPGRSPSARKTGPSAHYTTTSPGALSAGLRGAVVQGRGVIKREFRVGINIASGRVWLTDSLNYSPNLVVSGKGCTSCRSKGWVERFPPGSASLARSVVASRPAATLIRPPGILPFEEE